MPWHTWEEQGCNGVCTALGLGGCSCLNPCVSVGMQQCSGSGSRVGLFEEDRLVPMLTRHLLPKIEQGDAYTAYFTWKGTVFSPRVMRTARVLSCRGSQHKP